MIDKSTNNVNVMQGMISHLQLKRKKMSNDKADEWFLVKIKIENSE